MHSHVHSSAIYDSQGTEATSTEQWIKKVWHIYTSQISQTNTVTKGERWKVKWSEVAQSCPTLCDPMECSLSGSSVHGIFQARVLEWIAISFSRGSSQPRNQSQVSRIAGRRFTVWAMDPTKKRYPMSKGKGEAPARHYEGRNHI